MSKALLERRLVELSGRIKVLARELAVAEEQCQVLAEQADEARLRSLVSETPIAEREHREAARHADAMARHRDEVRQAISDLERTQDELLDRLFGGS